MTAQLNAFNFALFVLFMFILFPYCYSRARHSLRSRLLCAGLVLGNSAAHKAHFALDYFAVSVTGERGTEKGQMAIIMLCFSIVLIITGGQRRLGT